MDLFIVELAEEKRGVEVEPRQSQLAIAVPARHIGVLGTDDLRDEPTELGPAYVLGDKGKVILLGNDKVRLVLDQMTVRSQVSHRCLSNSVSSVGEWRKLAEQELLPKPV